MEPGPLPCCARAKHQILFSYVYAFAYGCTAKTGRNTMLYYKIISCRHQHVICVSLNTMEFSYLDLMFSSDFRLFFVVHYFLDYTRYSFLFMSEHNLHVPLSQNIRIEHWLLSQETLRYIQESERVLFHSYFQVPPGGKPIEMRYASCFYQVVFSYLVPWDDKNLFVLPLRLWLFSIIWYSLHICKLAPFMFDLKGESNEP
jgi:hypothetical protein